MHGGALTAGKMGKLTRVGCGVCTGITRGLRGCDTRVSCLEVHGESS